MKKNLIPIILVSLSCLLLVVAITLIGNGSYFQLSNNSSKSEVNASDIKPETDKEDEEIQDVPNDDGNVSNSGETVVDESKDNNSNSVNDDNKIIDQVDTFTEQDVVTYFQNTDDDFNDSLNQEDEIIRQKIKNGFVTVIDFIFYDKEIKGYTFSQLTTTAKLQVIKIALSIDKKIDDYFPNYKDKIKDSYSSIKGKLALKYLEFTQSLCESVGENTCNQAKKDFNTMKESFSFTWQLLKELAVSGSNKVKEFYETWRDA